MLVLDTHAALWWSADPKRLSARAVSAIEAAEKLGVPSIVFWEISLLVRKGKLALAMPVAEWAEKLCRIRRVAEIPLTMDIAILADSLAMHPDPADRFIVASAIKHQAPLVTRDRLIRRLKLVQAVW